MNKGFFCKDSRSSPYFFLLLLCAVICLPMALAGKTFLLPSYQDLTQWVIYREFVNKSLAAGYFPIWCEGLFSGLDFAGWGHGSAFYPLAFCFALFKFATAAVFNLFLHATIAVFGFYFLARKIGLSKFSALAAASGYGFGISVPGSVEDFLPDIFATPFTPWIYGLSFSLVRGFHRRDFFALSALSGLQLLSGHMELIALQDLSLFIFLVVFLAFDGTGIRLKLRGLCAWFFSLSLGGFLGVISALPGLASYSQSFRKLPFHYGVFTFFPKHTLELEQLPVLLLVFSAILAAALLFSLRRRTAVFWALAVAIFLMLAQNFNWFNLLTIFYHIPIFRSFIPHGRGLPQVILMLFLLVGMGLDNMDTLSDKKFAGFILPLLIFADAVLFYVMARYLAGRLSGFSHEYAVMLARFVEERTVAAALLAALALVALGYRLSNKPGVKPSTWLKTALMVEFTLSGILMLPRNSLSLMDQNPEYLEFLKTINPAEFRIQSVYSFDQWEDMDSPLQTGILSGTRAPDAYITFSTLRYAEFLRLLDDHAFKVENGKVMDVQVPNILKRGDFISLEKLPLIKLLNLKYMVGQNKNLKSADHYFLGYELPRFNPRINVQRGGSFKELMVETPASFGLYLYITPGDQLVIDFSDGKKPQAKLDLQVFFSAPGGGDELVAGKSANTGGSIKVSLAGIANRSGNLILSVLSPGAEPSRSLELNARIENSGKYFKRLNYPKIDVWENPGAFPRAFVVHGVKIIPGKDERLAYLGSQEFDPSRTAVLENNIWLPLPEKAAAVPGEGVKITQADSFSGGIDLLARNFSPAALVLSESYYPGFRAWLDGRETKIFPVDHAFRGVMLQDPGVHRFTMRYQPVSFEVALWTEFAAALAWFCFFISGFGLRKSY